MKRISGTLRALATATLLGTSICAAIATPAFADDRDFSVINTGDVAITELYVSRSTAKDWGDNVLSLGPIMPGESRDIIFTRAAPGVCEYDLSDVGEDGSTGELDNVDLCSISVLEDNGATLSVR